MCLCIYYISYILTHYPQICITHLLIDRPILVIHQSRAPVLLLQETRLLLVLRGLPSLLCLGYLSVSIPVRMVQAWRSGKYIVWQDNTEARNTLDDIRKSYAGHHVTKLLRKPVIEL